MQDERRGYPIDDVLIDRLDLGGGDTVLELGCGRGFTLLRASERSEGAVVLGLDVDAEALGVARGLLDQAPAAGVVALADLAMALPVRSGSVTRVLCHNVLEQLADPPALLDEAARVLCPGGLSVWSHTDFESVVISGGDPDLTRRVVAAYAGGIEPGAKHGDGQMGRKLAGLVAASPLEREGVDTHVLLSTDVTGPAELRVRTTFAVLRAASLAGDTDLTVEELERWVCGLREAARQGAFLYAHTTFVVTARKPR